MSRIVPHDCCEPAARSCGYTSTQEIEIRAALQSSSSPRFSSCGSPSEIIITCLAPAAFVIRSSYAIFSRWSKLGISPNVSELMARVIAALFPTSLSGWTHTSPLP